MGRLLPIDLSFVCLLIYHGALKASGNRACPRTELHVTNMCSSDNYFSNFIYLDVHNASLYYLQSCVCTLHVLFSGTLYFVPIRTPQPDCGSVIHVTSNDGNQMHAFKCNGTTTFSVKTNDTISISVHNLGQLAYDTAYCYVVSLASDSGVGTNAFQIICPYMERKTTTSTTTPATTTKTTRASTEETSTHSHTTKTTETTPTSVVPKRRNAEYDVTRTTPLEVIITVAILVPVVIIGLLAGTVYMWRRNIIQNLLRNIKKEASSQEDVVIDMGDGLKENVSQHSGGEDPNKVRRSKVSSANVKLPNATPRASRVTLRKSHSDRNIIVLAPEQPRVKDMRNGSDESDDVMSSSAKKKSTLEWRKSESEESYFTEIHLGGGSKTIITVERPPTYPKTNEEEHIKYDDIRTEL
ncbi:uncharacterized protein LOC111104393 isoform X1 [Crassostrea virginica]